ncbi:NlpC/P60 family protein [Paenibacillus whitsoniae]|uniref:NlpC/P60 family protein n=2 Tax=Paenibacillus whitsoniae TaxID=2496558 RepID=A0A430JJ21_9BACL|nr:NlpC/P60 family protein [Paenibacillus whitsoniae]
MNKNRLTKSLLGITLSLSLFASANLIMTTQSAHAASATTVNTVSTKATNIIATGKQYLGVKYVYGTQKGRTNAFDCSSFTQFVFGKYGITLPRSSKEQSQVGAYVPRNQLKPGDLVFFYSPIHHVGIYMGNGKVLHTYGSPGVTVSDMNSGWWSKHYKTARRVIQ